MADPAFLPDPSRSSSLQGLDPGRLWDEAMSQASNTEFRDGPRQTPSLGDLAALLPEYEMIGITGRGGMGTVYQAVQKNLGRPVAIKVLPVDLGDEPGFADRFRREAMTTAGLPHPDIVAVYDTGETVAGHWFYVMEFVEGPDLALRLAGGRMPLEEIVPLLEVICGALQAAHAKGIVHRDIKPSNILLTAEGRPKLADFGLALLMRKNLEYSRLTLGGTTLGTLEYAAPEQLDGTGATPASDIYSLGVLTYELLTGELPRGVFDPPSVRNSEVDPAFDGVVLRALQSDPDRRFETAGEFCQALQQAADRRWQQAQRERLLRQKLVRRARLATVFAAIALLAGASAFYAWHAKREANERRAAAVAAEAKTDGVIQFLLTDLRRRLEATGNLDAMESVLERAVRHYREKYAASGQTPETAVLLADVLVTKGDVIGVRGLNAEADALFTEAINLTTAAHHAAPGAASGLRVVAAWQDRSEHRMGTGRYPEALTDARRMLAEAEALQSLGHSVPIRRTLATAHRAIANALGYTGPLEESREEYLAAQRILAALAGEDPGNESLNNALAELDTSLGSLAEEQQQYPEMLRHFTAYHDYVVRLYGKENHMYSYAAFRMGVAMVKSGRPAEAVPYLTDALRLAEVQAAAQPGHQGALNHVAWCLRLMISAHEALGNAAQAAAFQEQLTATMAKQEAGASAGRLLPRK